MIPTLRILFYMDSLRKLAPFWLFALVLAVWWGSALIIVALAYGIVMQFFVEYVMHRFLYHRAPPQEQGTFNDLYRSHIGHHEFPNDPELFTGGPSWFVVKFGLASATMHTLILWPFLGFDTAAMFSVVALFLGSVSAFAFYEYCHTLAHLKVEKGWFGRKLTHDHLRHHYNDHDSNYHVSFGMGWIDRLMGTPYQKETAKDRFDRDTILSLGMDPEDLRLVTARKTFGLPPKPSAQREM